jgi:hypothetical protein
MTALVVIEGIVILLLLVLVAGLLRSHADILRRLETLGAGEDVALSHTRGAAITSTPTRTEPTSLTSISGPTPLGDTASVALTDSRGYVLLAFLSSGCTTCQTFWKSFRNGMDLPRTNIRPVIVTQGPESESPSEIRARAPKDITTIMSSDAWDAFRVPGTPYFQLVDVEKGLVVGEGSAGTWPRLMDLIARSTGDESFSPIKLGTKERQEDSDQALRDAGIDPGDPSMYRRNA